MIFKQIDEILSGQKTQTRRVCKPNEYENNPSEPPSDCESVITETLIPGTTGSVLRTKWAVGRTYAVVPGRGQPAVWWRRYGDRPQDYFVNWGIEWHYASEEDIADGAPELCKVDMRDLLPGLGFQPARIRITAIRREPLQSISQEDAWAEGVSGIEEYKYLWHSINGKTKGARWEDNPDVFVLSFELVR